jgi:hypothetical protein
MAHRRETRHDAGLDADKRIGRKVSEVIERRPASARICKYHDSHRTEHRIAGEADAGAAG